MYACVLWDVSAFLLLRAVWIMIARLRLAGQNVASANFGALWAAKDFAVSAGTH